MTEILVLQENQYVGNPCYAFSPYELIGMRGPEDMFFTRDVDSWDFIGGVLLEVETRQTGIVGNRIYHEITDAKSSRLEDLIDRGYLEQLTYSTYVDRLDASLQGAERQMLSVIRKQLAEIPSDVTQYLVTQLGDAKLALAFDGFEGGGKEVAA